MPEMLEPETSAASLDALQADAETYFDRAEAALGHIPQPERWETPERDHFWSELPPEISEDASRLTERLLTLAGRIADAVRNSPLASEADQRDLMTGTKAMRAALLLREFHSWSTEVINDEDRILGVHPAGQSEDTPSSPQTARRVFANWTGKIRGILDLVTASRGLGPIRGEASTPARYRPGTAFK